MKSLPMDYNQKWSTFVKFLILNVYFASLNIVAKPRWQLVIKIKLNIMVKSSS
jgi:hypothetical protein